MPQADLQQLPANSNNKSSSSSSSASTTADNSEVMQQLQGKGPELPQTDLGAVESGKSFAEKAGSLLDSVVPAEESSLKLTLTGAIPLYKTPGITVTFKPSLSMGVENKFGKIRASMQLAAAVEVSAGVDVWFVELQAALEASFTGTLNIHGDSGSEIFHEFLMSLRYIIEGACETVKMPERFKDPIVTGIMSDQAMQDTIEGMDDNDKVWLELKAGLKGTASAGLDTGGWLGSDEEEEEGGSLGGSVSGSVSHHTILKNDGNDSLTTENQNSVSVQVGPFSGTRKKMEDGSTLDILNAKASIPILSGSADASILAILSNKSLTKLQLKATLSQELTLEMLTNMMFKDTTWISNIKEGVLKGLLTINNQLDNPLLSKLAAKLASTPTEASTKTLSAAGEELAEAGNKWSYDSTFKVALDTQLVWGKGKGLNFRVQICTNSSNAVGFGENKITLTRNSPLMTLSVGDEGVDMDFHVFN